MRRILIRVDATSEIGMGHLMRMVSLGQILTDHGCDVHFATVGPPSESTRPVSTNNFTLHHLAGQALIGSSEDAAALRALIEAVDPDWVILDGNGFGTNYQRMIKESGRKVMSVDDLARGHFVSDAVLNQNYGAERFTYSAEPYTRMLLGADHVLLRREFRAVDPGKRQPNEPPVNILVSLGGGSLAGGSALDSLLRGLLAVSRPGLRFRVLAGMLNAPADDLRALAASDLRVELIERADRMVDEMSWADVAICSAGSTMWELIYMGVPFLAVALNESQLDFLATLEQDGICVSLGSHVDLDQARVQRTVESVVTQQHLRRRLVESSAGLIDPVRAERKLLAVIAGG